MAKSALLSSHPFLHSREAYVVAISSNFRRDQRSRFFYSRGNSTRGGERGHEPSTATWSSMGVEGGRGRESRSDGSRHAWIARERPAVGRRRRLQRCGQSADAVRIALYVAGLRSGYSES